MSIRHTLGFVWVSIILTMLLASCQLLQQNSPSKVQVVTQCDMVFVLLTPPALPGVPQLTPAQAADRNVSDKILVDYIGTIRRINRQYQLKVSKAYQEYRQSCR